MTGFGADYWRTMPEEQFLYLTTTGQTTGLPRQIEIWFVSDRGRFYIFSSGSRRAQWVQNIERDARVKVRVADREFPAAARVLDESSERELWDRVQGLARAKYGWGVCRLRSCL